MHIIKYLLKTSCSNRSKFDLKSWFKSVKRRFWTSTKKLKKCLKKRNFDPHAAKALNKKLWYLKDQAMAGTINPEDHQAGLTSPMTGQKEPHQEVRQPTRQIGTNRPLKKAQNVQAYKPRIFIFFFFTATQGFYWRIPVGRNFIVG